MASGSPSTVVRARTTSAPASTSREQKWACSERRRLGSGAARQPYACQSASELSSGARTSTRRSGATIVWPPKRRLATCAIGVSVLRAHYSAYAHLAARGRDLEPGQALLSRSGTDEGR